MQSESFFGLAARLHAFAFGLSLSLVCAAGLAYINLHSIAALTDHTRTARVPQLQRVAAVELDIARVSLQLRDSMLARTTAEMEASLSGIREKRDFIGKTLAAYQTAISNEKDRELFDQAVPLVDRFWQAGMENIELIRAGKKAEASAFLADETIPVRNELLALLAQSVASQYGLLDEEIHSIEASTLQTLQLLLALVAVVATFVGLSLFCWCLCCALRARAAVSSDAAGPVSRSPVATSLRERRNDEVSALSQALAGLQTSLKRLVADTLASAESIARTGRQNATLVEQPAAAVGSLPARAVELLRATAASTPATRSARDTTGSSRATAASGPPVWRADMRGRRTAANLDEINP